MTLQGRYSTNPHGPWHRMAHRWHQLSGPPVILRNPTRGNPSFTVPVGTPEGETFEFRLTVTDRDRETDSDTMTVTVTHAPRLPIAHAGADLRAAPGEGVTLQGGGSINPNGPWWHLTFRWQQISGPSVALRNPTRGTPSFIVPADAAAGASLRFRLTVTDRDDETSTDTVTVTVSDATLPSVAIATVRDSVSAGSPGQFRVTVNPPSTTDLRVHLSLAATGSPGVATGASR